MRIHGYFIYCLLALIVFTPTRIAGQHVGIGTNTPTQQLDVNGGIRVGGTAIATPGAIRWNAPKSDFEGFNGVAWVSLTGGKGHWGNQAAYATENSATQTILQHANKPGTELGWSLAAAGNWAITGAYRDAVPDQPTRWDAGSIRVYKRTGDTWDLRWTRFDPDATTNDHFGFSVGISSTHVIGGAPNADPAGLSDAGKAYVYAYDSTAINLQATLTASDQAANDFFGRAVAISGDHLVVGAPGNDILGLADMGRAYVFTRSGSTWSQTHVLTPSDGAATDGYGDAVAAGENYLAIAAPYKAINGLSYAGKVYVYRKNAGAWTLAHQLSCPDSIAYARFGSSLAIRNDVLLIGSPGVPGSNTPIPGKVYRYALAPGGATLEATLAAPDGAPDDSFGTSVALDDDVMLIGAPRAANGALARQGKAYAFEFLSGGWVPTSTMTSSTREAGINLGKSVALCPGWGLAGAPLADLANRIDNGQVFLFKRQ